MHALNNSLEVKGEEYFLFFFLVHKEPHKIGADFCLMRCCPHCLRSLENNIRVNEPNTIVISDSELSHLVSAYIHTNPKCVRIIYMYYNKKKKILTDKSS